MGVELVTLQEQLGVKKGRFITQEIVDELNRLTDDPEYGQEFLDSYISYFNITEKNKHWCTTRYMNAMKFFCLVEGEHSAVDAYVKVFPERLEARLKRGQNKHNMTGEASRYNASALVNEIRKVATIPVQLIHRNLLHEAILKQASLMNDSRVSPAVQQKAAETLIRELKPSEDQNVNLKIGMSEDMKIQQGQLVDHLGQIALNQQRLLAGGMSIEEIQKLNIQVTKHEDIIDGEIE